MDEKPSPRQTFQFTCAPVCSYFVHFFHAVWPPVTVSCRTQDVASALGHDLSFVKYMFLMEPIWDLARELQVISRAHRMGAKEPIVVEKIIAVNTVETLVEHSAVETTKEQTDTPQYPPASSPSSLPGMGQSHAPMIEKEKKRKEEGKRNRILLSVRQIRNIYPSDSSRERNQGNKQSSAKRVRFAS